MTLRHLRYLPVLVAALAACGGISDPTKGGEKVQTISGALTGGAATPAGAHIALIWRNPSTSTVVVGADAPIVNGAFTMDLSEPADAYFFSPDSDSMNSASGSGGSVDVPPTTTGNAPSSGGGAPPAPKGVRTQTVSGSITGAFEVAVAGFVVYVDTNGNGQLDLSGSTASSTDQLIGGNNEIFLTYLRGGGQLDYEKLRDSSGILPAAGFNLAWKKGRWLPLNEVELKLTSNVTLPSTVCSGGGPTTVDTPVAEPTTSFADAGTGPGYYPSPTDPDLQCAPDGRSYSMKSHCPPPPPPGLCSSDIAYGCAGGGADYLSPGTPIPDGWPCPVEKDGGIDGGSFDASTDAGAGSDGGI